MQTAPKTGPPKGTPADHPAKTGNTKPRVAAQREEGHPKHADTRVRHPDKDNETQDRDNQRPTPQSPPVKKTKGRGGQTPPTTTPAQPGPQASPQDERGQAGHRHDRTHTPTTQRRGTAHSKTRAQHSRPHSTPHLGKAGYKRGAHTNTHTPQHPSQEWRGAAATQAQPHTGAPHPQPGGARDYPGGGHKHTHTPTSPQGEAGRSPNPDPSTHAHTAHQKPGTAGSRRSVHTATRVQKP